MNQNEFIEVSKEFFRQRGGNIRNIYHAKRRNIEIIEIVADESIDVLCFEVEFSNRNIFGSSTYMEAYKRYRQMRNDWWECLERSGFEQWSKNTKIIGHFIPLLSLDNVQGEPYPIQESTSYGQILTEYHEAKTNNAYYKHIHETYGLKWLLQDGNNIVIGPDIGLFYGMLAYIKSYGRINHFLDIGTGTAELSAYLIKNKLVSHITACEISTYLQEHIRNYLGNLNQDNQTMIDFQFVDALDMTIPEKFDLLSLGIYYGAQPDYFKKHGQKIRNSLSENGIVIVQSGMLEGKFNLFSIIGNNEDLYRWDWYKKENTLTAYFSEIDSVFVGDEVLTIASNHANTMNLFKQTLINDFGASEIPKMEMIQYV